MNFKAPLAALVLLAFLIPAASAAERGILLRTAFASAAKEKQRQPKPKRARFVEPDFATLSAPALRKNETRKIERALTAALFDDTVLHIALESVEHNAADVDVWTGKVEGDDASSVSISMKDRAMVATIATMGKRYMIEPVENGAHEAFELDAAQFPNESESLQATPAGASKTLSANGVTANDTGATIDVLVLYTDDLRAALGGTAAAQAAASSAIAAANTAYQNSGVVPRVRLAGTSEVQYNETGAIDTTLTQLSSTSDGIMDQVHTLRNQLGADDVALLVVDGGGSCGIAYIMSSYYVANPQVSFAPNGFAVIANSCAVGNLSFPHELGHNFGLAHDRFVSPGSNPSYPYAFGFVDSQNQFRDIMAYANACGGSCPRVQYFSSPNLSYLGRPLGISYESSPSTSADNVRALNNNAALIANWRQSVAAPSFSDNPLVAGSTRIRALHVTELRTAINNYRASASLGAYSWTSTITAATTIVTAAQIAELRTALTPALTALGRAAVYTNTLAAGNPIRAVDVQELRNYLQ